MALKFHLPGLLLTEICFQSTKLLEETLTVLTRKTSVLALRLKAYVLPKPCNTFVDPGGRRQPQLEKGCIFGCIFVNFTSTSRSLLENLPMCSSSKTHYSGKHSFQGLTENYASSQHHVTFLPCT